MLAPQESLVARYLVVSAEPWTPEQCDVAYKILRNIVKTFLTMVTAEGVDVETGTEYLTACRSGKMSFHVIADCLKLERGYLSCRYLSWELARFSWQWMNNILFRMEDSPHRDVLLRLSMLHKQADNSMQWFGMNDTMFDEVIYSRNRQFRLVGNAKLGGIPLSWLHGTSAPSEAMRSPLTSVNGK